MIPEFNFNINIDELTKFFEAKNEIKKLYTDLETSRLFLKHVPSDAATNAIYKICLKEDMEEIGEIQILEDDEIWYKIFKKSNMRKGYTTEAMRKVLSVRPDAIMSLHIIHTDQSPIIASIKVARKLGFKFKGIKAGGTLIYESR